MPEKFRERKLRRDSPVVPGEDVVVISHQGDENPELFESEWNSEWSSIKLLTK